jgi:Spy/CpxP family protein refolding chaperone
MIRFSMLAGCALAVVLFATSSASAQFGRNFRIPPVVSDIMSMRAEKVQKELALSEEQTTAIVEIAAEMQSDAMEIISGLQDLTPDEREEELPNVMEMISERAAGLQKRLDKILDEKQMARIGELSLQRRGSEALDDEKVAKALKITADQKKQLAAIQDAAATEQEAMMKEFFGGDRDELRGKIRALNKEMADKALAVLTTEQTEQLDKMKGAKFEFPRRRGFGF